MEEKKRDEGKLTESVVTGPIGRHKNTWLRKLHIVKQGEKAIKIENPTVVKTSIMDMDLKPLKAGEGGKSDTIKKQTLPPPVTKDSGSVVIKTLGESSSSHTKKEFRQFAFPAAIMAVSILIFLFGYWTGSSSKTSRGTVKATVASVTGGDELIKVKAELASVQSELKSTQAKLEAKDAELVLANQQLESTKTELALANSQIEDFKIQVAGLQLINESTKAPKAAIGSVVALNSAPVSPASASVKIKSTLTVNEIVRDLEGVETPIAKQLIAKPSLVSDETMSYKGDLSDKTSLKVWAGNTSHKVAALAGYYDQRTGKEVWVKTPNKTAIVLLADANGKNSVQEYTMGEDGNFETSVAQTRQLASTYDEAKFLGDLPGNLGLYLYVYAP